jgi:diamine N-acetyltransferase
MAVVRKAEQGDLVGVRAIEAIVDYRSLLGSWTESEHAQAFNDPDIAYWVISKERGAVDGFCIVRGLRSEHRSAELKRIAVRHPDAGLGRQLLTAVCRMLFTEHGCHRIWLDVFVHNDRAKHLYRSLGFREDGVLREAVYRDGAYHSLVLMSVLDREFIASGGLA